MIKNSNYMLNVQENLEYIMASDTCSASAADYACEETTAHASPNQVMIDNFIFSHLYNADIGVDVKVQYNVRRAAFRMVDDKHLEMYKRRIDNRFFLYYDRYSETVALNGLPSNMCCHYYIKDLERIISCIKELECSFNIRDRGNVLIFYPYLKQLRCTSNILKESFACCLKLISDMQMYINDVISHCLLCVEKLELINKTIKVMNLFVDDIILYECNICKEVSADERFLKPKECCEFSICNACCVTLWKTSATHAKCPACRTSFKSLN